MTRIYSKSIKTISTSKQGSLVLTTRTELLAGWKGVSVLAEPIRVIVVIVGHPREVFDDLNGTRLLSILTLSPAERGRDVR